MSTSSSSLKPEWSHRVDVETISQRPTKLSILADESARKDLARRLRLRSIDSLVADFSLEREIGSMVIHVEGHVKAKIVQNCISTGEPVYESIDESFESWFADPSQAVPFVKARRERLVKGEREMELLPERDDPEIVENGVIDIAEIATQYMSLGINSYPRVGDVPPIGDEVSVQVVGPARKNPFDALKDWKSRQTREK
jgi:uncharacterized metal-binding protein YceD (DUF177 family)